MFWIWFEWQFWPVGGASFEDDGDTIRANETTKFFRHTTQYAHGFARAVLIEIIQDGGA